MQKRKRLAITLLSSVALIASATANMAVAESTDSACGLVSVYPTPPRANELYTVNIDKVDGEVYLRSKQHFKLSPGKHIIHVKENIDPKSFTRIGNAFKHHAKSIEVDVVANQQIYLAAKFFPNKRISKAYSEDFWEPVIIKTMARECEL